MAVCMGMIPLAPIAALCLTMYNDDVIDKAGFQIVSLILLGICAGISVGLRCVLEIIVDRIAEAFPTLSSLAFMGLQLLFMFAFLLLLLFFSLCLLPDGEHLFSVCLCFLCSYGFYVGIMNTYYHP